MRACMCGPAAACAANCWPRCVTLRKAQQPLARGTNRRDQIANMTPITARPAEVPTRTVPGHWEGDLTKGARNGPAVGTQVERTTRLVILARITDTDMRSARAAAQNIDVRRGKEMAEHARLAERLAIRIFFADPSSPWQRGTNENTMGCCASTCPRAQTCRAIPSVS